MLAKKITEYLEGQQHFSSGVLEKACVQFGGSLARQFMGQETHTPSLRMSNIGHCPRKVWMQIAGEKPEPLNARTRMNFAFGDMVETAVVGVIRLMAEQEHYGIKINEELVQKELDWEGIKGHADLPCTIDGQNVVVEVKSMSNYGFRDFCKNGPDETWGYPHQLQAYMRGLDWQQSLWIGVRKETGHFDEFIMHRDDKTYVPLALDIMELVNTEEKPDKPEWAVLKAGEIKDIRCCYCALKEPCWGKFEVIVDNRGKPHYKVG